MGLRIRIPGIGFRVPGFEFRVLGSGLHREGEKEREREGKRGEGALVRRALAALKSLITVSVNCA